MKSCRRKTPKALCRASSICRPSRAESVALDAALGRALAHDIAAPLDVPPFDRSGVDGFAVRAEDTCEGERSAPLKLRLNAEVIACGHAPHIEVASGTASTIATGGMLPRGADAVVMIEQTELHRRSRTACSWKCAARPPPGNSSSYAGSDIARGETLLRRGTLIGSREIGMLAACGLAVDRCRTKTESRSALDRRRIGAARRDSCKPAGIYDSNGAIVAAAVTEAGGLPVPFGAFADDEKILDAAMRRASPNATW